MHTRLSGVADHLAENDTPRAALARRIVGQPEPAASPSRSSCAAAERAAATTAEELYGVIPADTRKPFDVREIIARVVDGSRFDEFKARYGTTLVTRLCAHLTACRWASSPTTASCSASRRRRARTSSSCAASARSRWCSCRTSPASWWAASTKTGASPSDGAKMVTAVATAQVPKFTVIIGGSFGAGNYGMCGRAY